MMNFFITGLFRSGTTLLSRAISANRHIHVSYQPLASLFKLATVKFWEKMGVEGGRPLGDPLIIEKHWRTFERDLRELKYTPKELQTLRHDLCRNYSEDSIEKDKALIDLLACLQGSSFGGLLESTFSIFRTYLEEISGKNIIGIKEVWGEDFIPYLSAAGFKCIHLIRDPRGIIASRNYGEYLRKSCGGRKYPVLFIARSWRRSLEVSRKLSGLQNYLLVRYEDILGDPEKILREICNFLETGFSDSMVDVKNYRGGDGRRWRGNANSRQFDSIDKGGGNRWRTVLSDDEVFLCEFLCAEEMKALGYDLITDYNDAEKFFAIEEDANAAGSWLAGFNHLLTEVEKRKELCRKGINIENKC